MPDYPFVYGAASPHPPGSGGTRIRVLRRKPREEPDEETHPDGSDHHDAWRQLLEEAVEAFNRSIEASGRPHRCVLEEDREGFWLRVHLPGGGNVEERLEPGELDQWLVRLRTRLGVMVDREA